MIQDPIDVRLMQPESEFEQIAGVLLGSLGVAGVILVIAVIVGLGLGAGMLWLRSRAD